MSTDNSADLKRGDTLSGPSEIDQAFDIPFKNPIKPVQLSLDSPFQFHCHKGISCFNQCCSRIEIQLTPYDIVRLKNHFEMTSNEFVARYTFPFEMDAHGMPGLHLTHKPGTRECIFLTENGCSVYQDRPTACRYYALGNMGVRKKESNKVDDIYFLVRENHCKGHEQPHTQTVQEYLREQGAEQYDEFNRQWRDIIIKKRSSGPTIGKPSERSLQLFDMCSYDLDSFREFIRGIGFLKIFAIDKATHNELISNEEALLRFAMRFLKQVLYGEKTIPLAEAARDKRLQERKQVLKSRKQNEIEAYRKADPLETPVDS